MQTVVAPMCWTEVKFPSVFSGKGLFDLRYMNYISTIFYTDVIF